MESEFSQFLLAPLPLHTHNLNTDIDLGTKNLIALTGASDGLQLTNDSLTNTRHFANTLFNLMRGGIFDDDYNVEKEEAMRLIDSFTMSNKKDFQFKIFEGGNHSLSNFEEERNELISNWFKKYNK